MHTGRLIFSQVMDYLPMHTFRQCVNRYQGNRKTKKILVPRSVPLYGFCSAHIQRKSARYRSLPKSPTQKIIPHGHPWWDSPQHSCQCQQKPRLANLCRPGTVTDRNSSRSLHQRGSWPRSRQYSLCTRRINYRFVFVSVPVGHFSTNKSSSQIAHTARSTRQHTNIYSHNRWQSARRQCSRYSHSRTRSFLHNGQRVCRFQAPLYNAQHGAFFLIRAKSNSLYKRRYSYKTDTSGDVICDQTIVLTGLKTSVDYPQALRRVKYHQNS